MTESIATSEPAGERLKQLAEAHGVSTEYWDYHGNLAAPSRATLVAVLAALGVEADGLMGPDTANALAARYGLEGDGALDAPSPTVEAMQRELLNGGW